MANKPNTRVRLLTSQFYRRPHQFLTRQAQLQGERLWFQERDAPWLVIHHPGDVRELLSLPPDVVDGSRAKRSLIPWLTDKVLPGMDDQKYEVERRIWVAKSRELSLQDIPRHVRRVVHGLDAAATGRVFNFSQWCNQAATDVATSMLHAGQDVRGCRMVRSMSDPIGPLPASICRRLTIYQFKKMYRRFIGALPTSASQRDTTETQRKFLMFAGFVVNLSTLLRHVFAEVMRDKSGIAMKIRDEANRVREPSNWEYSQAVCNESLRCAPNLALLVREAQMDFQLSEIRIAKGTVVAACPFLTHHRQDVFRAPDSFDPNRFYHQPAKQPWQYYPYGFGARACPISWLSRDIVAMILTMVVAKYDLAPINNQPNPVTFSRSLLSTTRSRHDRVRLRKRNDAWLEFQPPSLNEKMASDSPVSKHVAMTSDMRLDD